MIENYRSKIQQEEKEKETKNVSFMKFLKNRIKQRMNIVKKHLCLKIHLNKSEKSEKRY